VFGIDADANQWRVAMTSETSERPSWPFERRCPLSPPPAFAELREKEPITEVTLWNGSSAWLATRYEDIRALLVDRRLSSDTSKEGFPQSSATVVAQRGGQKSLPRMDPPRHDEHRSMLAADFMIKQVRKLRPYLDELLDRVFDEMAATKGPVELVTALAQPIPANVITELLDLPREHSEFFLDRVNTWMSLDSTPEVAAKAGGDALEYFDQLIGDRMENPGDDLVSRLIRERMNTGALSRPELQHMLHLLLIGGFDTTANMISLGTLLLLENPDQLDQLKADPGLAPKVVEELLRYLSVAHHVAFRLSTEDVEIRGRCIHAGDGVIAPILAANHDPEVFPDPERFDIHRDARGHLAFGYGLHQCLGQPLARVELQAVFARLFVRFPNLRLAVNSDQLRFKNALIYGVEEMPVLLD
jgi:cytochrome P450